MHIRNTYAITTVTAQRRALLQSLQNANLSLDTLFHDRDQGRCQRHGFAIMPEHVHILLTPAIDQTIERCAPCIKGGFSHALPIKPIGGVWQPSFHQHRTRDAEDFRNQLTYIAENPTRRHLQNHPWTHTNHPTKIDPLHTRFL